jgi:Trp operon repressor
VPRRPNDGDDGADAGVQRELAQPCLELQSAEDREQAAALLTRLPEREQRIVRLRFGQDLTQRQIAERIGVSQMQVSRPGAAVRGDWVNSSEWGSGSSRRSSRPPRDPVACGPFSASSEEGKLQQRSGSQR